MIKNEGLKKTLFSLLGLCFVALVASPAYAAPATVNSVKVSDKNGNVQIVVKSNESVSNYVYRQAKPNQALVVELFPAKAAAQVQQSKTVDTGLVQSVKVVNAAEKANTVKVIVNVVSQPKFTLASVPGKKGVVMNISNKMSAETVAQTTATVTNTTVAKKATVKTVAKKASKKVSKNGAAAYRPASKLVNMDLVNADLVYVLKILAKEMNMNIVTDPTVQGSVTMTLKSVPASGALNLVTKVSGFDYKIVGNTIVVGDPKLLAKISPDIMEVKKGAEVTQAIPLEHAKAADIMGLVSSTYPDVKATADPRGTALIVTADPKNMKAIRSFVSQLDYDVPAPVPPRTEIVALKGAKAEELMPILQKLVPTVSYDIDKRLNSLIVTGDDANISLVKDYLEQLDAHLKQLSIDLKVVDLSEEGSKSIGAQWHNQAGSANLVDLTFNEHASNYKAGPDLDKTNGEQQQFPIPIGYFTRTALSLNMTIAALVSSGEAKVLASPTITTKSGVQAEVHIGQRYPVVYYDPRAGQYQVQYTDIGTNVVLTATVLPDGYIDMDLQPSISTFLGLVNQQYPRTAQRDAKINLRVKDGDTMVLAGLLREEERIDKTKIPLLGDIPIIGALFRTTDSSKSKNEVVIMVTPHILPD